MRLHSGIPRKQLGKYAGSAPAQCRQQGSIDSNDVVTLSGKHFTRHAIVNFQVTVTGATLADNDPDGRTQAAETTADSSGSFSNVTVSPEGFGLAIFQYGTQAFVIAGETITAVASLASPCVRIADRDLGTLLIVLATGTVNPQP